MGCGSSKPLEEEDAVKHCLRRTRFLAEAINHRYALADAHLGYSRSLRSVAAALQDFLLAAAALPPGPPSPVLNLTAARKGDPLPSLARSAAAPAPAPAVAFPAAGGAVGDNSHSGSHIKFHDDEDGDDDDDLSPFHSDSSSPARDHHLPPDMDDFPGKPSAFANVSYSRNQPAAPSVAYEQRPQIPETVQFGAGTAAAAYPYNIGMPYPVQSSNIYSYPYPYMPYGPGGGMGGSLPFYGPSSPPPSFPMTAGDVGGYPSTSRAPPPPPSPPTTSNWDFLNPFDSFDDYYPPYSPNRSLKDVREEEGIPDLEEDHEVVKEAYGDQKFAPSTSAGMVAKEGGVRSVGEDLPRKSKDTGSSISEHEIPVVEKSVVSEQEQAAGSTAPSRSYHNVYEIVQEIRTQFDRASESAEQVAEVLEVGKRPYHHKSSAMAWICGLPSLPASNNEEPLFFEEQKANLSSTLQKLYMWEKKLLEEVKAEEKLRLLYERKCELLSDLRDRGAESEKIEALQTFIRKLSTKIKIEIHIVETISNNIHKLRDQELWPQIYELVQGFSNMWRNMFECHRIQFQAISQAKNLDSIVSSSKLADAQMEATKHLELELLNCVGNFSLWVTAQNNYVKLLNDWLVEGLHYEPEVTDDGPVPFSPGRLGAPPVFVICNHWSQIMDRISEKDVITSMQTFADNVWGLWERHNFQHRQSLMANKDMDGKLRLMERDHQVIQKAREAQTKKIVPSDQGGIIISKQVVHQDAAADLGNMQSSLKQVFEAMENFTTSSTKAYEELFARCQEEERLARDEERIS